MGQISARLIKRLGKSRSQVAELRRESGSIRDALDALKHGGTARSRRTETLDSLHAVYVAVQNVTSVFAERVSVLPECDPYYRVVLDAQETYMPSGPPWSPLTGSYFIEAAERLPDFRAEIPAFVAEIKTIFEPWQLVEFLKTARQTEPFDPDIYEGEDPEDIEMERQSDLRRSANDLLLVEQAREWLLKGEDG